MESHQKAARAYDDGLFDELVTPWGGVTRDNNIRADSNLGKLGQAAHRIFKIGRRDADRR